MKRLPEERGSKTLRGDFDQIWENKLNTKTYSNSLLIKEMQIKTIMKFKFVCNGIGKNEKEV